MSLVPQDSTSVQQEWFAPLNITGTLFPFTGRYSEVGARDVLRYMALDSANPSSIYCCARGARENARAVRGSITSEMWEVLNSTWLELQRMSAERLDSEGVIEFFAPVHGFSDVSEVRFDFSMHVARIQEEPRVTKPYTDAQWQGIEALGRQVDAELVAGDVRLTMGGEPTFVSVDDMDGNEWNSAALGEKKRELAGTLLHRLHARFAPGGLLHYGQGKWYPGEPLPRWPSAACGAATAGRCGAIRNCLPIPRAPLRGVAATRARARRAAASAAQFGCNNATRRRSSACSQATWGSNATISSRRTRIYGTCCARSSTCP
jgi:hypothetical protein